MPGKRRALVFNLLSGLTFLVGGLVAYTASLSIDDGWLVPLAAGNFLYIGASDLVPEVSKPHSLELHGSAEHTDTGPAFVRVGRARAASADHSAW